MGKILLIKRKREVRLMQSLPLFLLEHARRRKKKRPLGGGGHMGGGGGGGGRKGERSVCAHSFFYLPSGATCTKGRIKGLGGKRRKKKKGREIRSAVVGAPLPIAPFQQQ